MNWLPDGSGMIVLAEDEVPGTYQLWFLSTGDGVMRRITHDTSNYAGVSITADGNQMLTVQFVRAASIWVGPAREPARAQQVVPGPAGFDKLVWLSGDQLALDNEGSIWSVPATGGQLKRLTGNIGRAANPCVGSDGRYIFFILQHGDVPNLWRMDADGNNPVQLTKGWATLPSCSPNGNWVLFAGGPVENNKSSLWKIPVEGGEPVRLLEDSEGVGALSPDGKLLAYQFRDTRDGRSRLAVKPLEEGGTQKVFDDATAWNQIKWARDGRGLYYVSLRTGNLVYQPLAGGPPRTLVEHGKEYIFSLAFSPDGEQLAYVRGTNLNSLTLISDFKSRDE